MIADVGRKPEAYRSIRALFIIGLVGLILAASGVTLLLVEYAQVQAGIAQKEASLASRVALYKGSWIENQDPSFIISRIDINNNGLNMTIHESGNCRENSALCDMGTYTQTFTGEEPLTILLVFTDSAGAQVH